MKTTLQSKTPANLLAIKKHIHRQSLSRNSRNRVEEDYSFNAHELLEGVGTNLSHIEFMNLVEKCKTNVSELHIRVMKQHQARPNTCLIFPPISRPKASLNQKEKTEFLSNWISKQKVFQDALLLSERESETDQQFLGPLLQRQGPLTLKEYRFLDQMRKEIRREPRFSVQKFMDDFLETHPKKDENRNIALQPTPQSRKTSLIQEPSVNARLVSITQKPIELRTDYEHEIVYQNIHEYQCFTQLPKILIQGLCSSIGFERFRSFRTIFNAGDQAHCWYIILSGNVEILAKGNLDGVDHLASKLSHGDAFGELALLSDTTRFATAVAKTDVELLVLSKPAYHRYVRWSHEAIIRDRMNFLSRTAILSRWNQSAIRRIAMLGSEKIFKNGSVIWNGSSDFDVLYFLKRGTATVTMMLDKEVIYVGNIETGEVFGHETDYNVIAKGQVEVLMYCYYNSEQLKPFLHPSRFHEKTRQDIQECKYRVLNEERWKRQKGKELEQIIKQLKLEKHSNKRWKI